MYTSVSAGFRESFNHKATSWYRESSDVSWRRQSRWLRDWSSPDEVALRRTPAPNDHRFRDRLLRRFTKSKSITALKSLRHAAKTCHWLVCDQVSDFFVVSKFHCFYLAQKSRKRVADLLDLSRHVEINLSCRRHVGDLLKTCRRPGFKQVLSKIDVMEFGHNPAVLLGVFSTGSQCSSNSFRSSWSKINYITNSSETDNS